jgi:2-oxoglutarate/2-oxoacid ferredoxin oxidoreductase subunit beta
LHDAHQKGEVLTGVFYVNPDKPTFLDMLNMTEDPLATLPQDRVRPPREALEAAMAELR